MEATAEEVAFDVTNAMFSSLRHAIMLSAIRRRICQRHPPFSPPVMPIKRAFRIPLRMAKQLLFVASLRNVFATEKSLSRVTPSKAPLIQQQIEAS